MFYCIYSNFCRKWRYSILQQWELIQIWWWYQVLKKKKEKINRITKATAEVDPEILQFGKEQTKFYDYLLLRYFSSKIFEVLHCKLGGASQLVSKETMRFKHPLIRHKMAIVSSTIFNYQSGAKRWHSFLDKWHYWIPELHLKKMQIFWQLIILQHPMYKDS